MDKSRRSNRCSDGTATSAVRAAAVVLASGSLALAAGCGASYVPVTALELPDASRQPDGVVIEPSGAVPDAAERAGARGVVALRAPLGEDAVVTLVHRLFRALAREDVEALQALLTEDAAALPDAATGQQGAGAARGGGGNASPSVVEHWRARLKNPSYARLAATASELVDTDRIARFTYEDLGGAGAPERPPSMKPGELLVRFPVATPTPRGSTERLFGDAMTLLLRRDGRTYKIAGMGEDNAP